MKHAADGHSYLSCIPIRSRPLALGGRDVCMVGWHFEECIVDDAFGGMVCIFMKVVPLVQKLIRSQPASRVSISFFKA
jgi:hypothetical protein